MIETNKYPYWKNNSFADKCRIVTNPEARKDILKEKKLCYMCARGLYARKNCRAKRNCFRCGGKHHTSICNDAKVRDVRRDDKNEVALLTDALVDVNTPIQHKIFNNLKLRLPQ